MAKQYVSDEGTFSCTSRKQINDNFDELYAAVAAGGGGGGPVTPGADIPATIFSLEAAFTAAQTDVALQTIAAGSRAVVTQVQALVDQACTVAVNFRIGFGATTTPTTAGVVASHPGLVPGAGISRGDGSAALGRGADGEDVRVTSSVPTGGSLRVLVTGYTTTP